MFDVNSPTDPPLFATKLESPDGGYAFDPRGQRLAMTDASRTHVQLVDVDTGRVDVLKAVDSLEKLAITTDGRTLIGFGIGGLVWKWDLTRQGTPASRLTLYTDRDRDTPRAGLFPTPSEDLVMSADAALLAFVLNDYWIVIWDLEQGRHLGTPTLPRPPKRIGFSADGTRLLAFSDRALTIVDLDPTRLAAHACRVAMRPLNDVETKQFQLKAPLPSVCKPAAQGGGKQ